MKKETRMHANPRAPGGAICRRLVLPVLAALAGPVLAQTPGPSTAAHYYGGVHGGVNLIDKWPAEVNFGGATAGGSLKLERSLHFGLFAGQERDKVRLELEYQRGRVEVESASLGPVTQAVSGKGRYQALTANAYRTFELAPRWNGYLGVGIGWGSVDLPQLAAVSGCNCFRDASENGLVVQARVGAEYQIDAEQFVSAQLTALRLPGPDSGTTPGVRYSSRWLGALSLGYRRRF